MLHPNKRGRCHGSRGLAEGGDRGSVSLVGHYAFVCPGGDRDAECCGGSAVRSDLSLRSPGGFRPLAGESDRYVEGGFRRKALGSFEPQALRRSRRPSLQTGEVGGLQPLG